MRKPTDPGSLVSRDEIESIVQRTRQRVHQMTERDDFPRPVVILRNGKLPIWRARKVEEWWGKQPESKPKVAT